MRRGAACGRACSPRHTPTVAPTTAEPSQEPAPFLQLGPAAACSASVSRTPEERLRAAMETLPGVSDVTTKPIGKGNKANDHGVRWKLHGKGDRCACTVPHGSRPTLMHAIEGALAKLRGSLGSDIVDQAVRDASAYTTEELAWLVEWCEEHPEPETITAQTADEALQQRRAAAAGNSASVGVLHKAAHLAPQQLVRVRVAPPLHLRLRRRRRQLDAVPEAPCDETREEATVEGVWLLRGARPERSDGPATKVEDLATQLARGDVHEAAHVLDKVLVLTQHRVG